MVESIALNMINQLKVDFALTVGLYIYIYINSLVTIKERDLNLALTIEILKGSN